MRYREDQFESRESLLEQTSEERGEPQNAAGSTLYPYGRTMHEMLIVTAVLAIGVGFALWYLGKRGNVMWLKWWSIGLVVAGVVYMIMELTWNAP